MGLNLAEMQRRLDAEASKRSSRKLILKVGQEAIVRVNPHPNVDEPYAFYQHWFENTQGKPRSGPCVEGDERWPSGCPACEAYGRPSMRFAMGVVDTRVFHFKKGVAGRTETYLCTAEHGTCPHCQQGSEPRMGGPVIWELSQTTAQQLYDVASKIANNCKCSGRLKVHGWLCPECDTTHEGKLPPLSVKHKCPDCHEAVIPQMLYSCDRCDNPRQAELHDVYLSIKRSGSQTYTIMVDSFDACRPEHQFPPINIQKALTPFSKADYMKAMMLSNDHGSEQGQMAQGQRQVQIQRTNRKLRLPESTLKTDDIPF